MSIDLNDVAWVRLMFLDVLGARHSLQIPGRRFADAADRGEVFDGSTLEGRARHLEADMLLRPDPATLVRWPNGEARALGNVLTPDGRPWPGDPRTALAAICADLSELADVYTAGAELEFYLLDADRRPADRGGYFGDTQGIGPAVVRQACEVLQTVGVEIDGFHLEAGPGQYEIDLSPRSPIDIADAIVLAKQAVREAAAEAGLAATFMARPLDGEAGSGLHLQQRLGARLMSGSTLSPDGRCMVAGQLAHARALCALAAPTVNSYKRLHAGPEAPGAAVWAHRNRAALVRVSADLGADASVEFRAADPSANPYLLVAGLLAAAADGMAADLRLGPPLEEGGGGFDPIEGDEVRFDPLPRSLDEALDALLADDLFVDTFDSRLLTRLVDGRRAEAEAFRSHVTRWELERYLDEA